MFPHSNASRNPRAHGAHARNGIGQVMKASSKYAKAATAAGGDAYGLTLKLLTTAVLASGAVMAVCHKYVQDKVGASSSAPRRGGGGWAAPTGVRRSFESLNFCIYLVV